MTQPTFSEVILRYYNERHDEHVRLGQFFINEYLPDATWAELYYEKDNRTAMTMINEYLSFDHSR